MRGRSRAIAGRIAATSHGGCRSAESRAAPQVCFDEMGLACRSARGRLVPGPLRGALADA